MTTTQEGMELVRAEAPRAMLAGMEPRALVAAATVIADELKAVIEAQKLSVQIGDPKYNDPHVTFPGWLTAGAMLQTFPHVVHSEVVRNSDGQVTGAKASAEARTLDGRVVSRADALCTRDERQKLRSGSIRFPWSEENATVNQVLSMAETRAAAKAMSFALRWIVTLAGYSGTPAEEMSGEPENTEEPEPGAPGMKDKELEQAVAPELSRFPETKPPRQPRDPATRRRAARAAATRPVPRQASEAEAVPTAVPWEEFFRRHGIVAAQAVSIIRSKHPTALGPEEDEAEAWPKVLELGEELPEGGKAEESHVAASKANELQRAASKLTSLDPARAVAAQEMLVSIIGEGKE